MNILMMTNTYLPIVGGLERSIESFTKEYRKRGHRVLIVAPEFKKRPKKELDVIRVPAIQNLNGSDFSVNLPIPGFLKVALGNFKPDLIHVHHPFLLGTTALRLAYDYRVPLIYTYHTFFEQTMADLNKGLEVLKRFVVELSTGYANLCDHVIAPSSSILQMLQQYGVTTPITVVPTGIYLKAFEKGSGDQFRKEVNIPKKAFVVGHIGRLAVEKNLEFLCQGAATFLKTEKKAYFLIVGNGPLKKKMHQYLSGLGLKNRTRFAGTVNRKNISDAFHAMDVFAFSSKSETQGIVLAEAMASGVPVVAVDAPGARDIVRDKFNGRLIPKENSLMFARALSWILNLNKSGRKKISDRAKKTAEEYSMDLCTESALSLYAKLKAKESQERKSEESIWSSVMDRIKAEWDLMSNLTKATKEAITADNETKILTTRGPS
ncbi:MAG: glycosyltransferase [Candidatus Omnitrophica bacterium]|nr:glycosyltransferase [Candidatus Omnitrophota bacterium]